MREVMNPPLELYPSAVLLLQHLPAMLPNVAAVSVLRLLLFFYSDGEISPLCEV